MADPAAPPALVVSLDFELHWGVRDIHPLGSPYVASLLGAREAIPRILDLFVDYDIAATWATVGFLMAESKEELESFHPKLRPRYADTRLDPYPEPIGQDEAMDPLHFAPGLVRTIHSTPRQEVGSHTYSHFYPLEEGASADAFRADVSSAVALARTRGIDLRSMVLPRNQWKPEWIPILREAGFECHRGNQPGWLYAPVNERRQGRLRRALRLADAHVTVTPWEGIPWEHVPRHRGVTNIPATAFLRPVQSTGTVTTRLRLRRVTRAMTFAARAGRLFHLWWHPHNFGARPGENLSFLRDVLEHYLRLAGDHGMQSMSMIEASKAARNVAEGAGTAPHD